MIGIFSSGIWRIPHLEKFLAQPCQKLSLLRPVPQEVDAIAVWGHRPSAAKPVAIAKAAGKPVIRLEDGFVRSLILASMASRRFLWWWMIVAFTTMPASLQHWRNWYRIKPEIQL